ncbi:MAG: hypothetical protein E6Q97_10955 [Desulfurellales bacterium]|nr:MAG: hypothetical protein E6Q97_10955 [Desulfurellales bacterium]
MIALILSSILVCVYALMEAADDFKQILNDEEINHKKQWITRAAFVATYLFFCGDVWWIIGLAGLFSAVFRWDLNGRRGKDWRYVSPSSWYDWQFIRWAPFFRGSNRVGRKVSASFMCRVYAINEHLQASIHRAGLLAYIIEALLFLGTIAIELFA